MGSDDDDDDDDDGDNFDDLAHVDQSVTYRYREFPAPGIFIFLVVSEPVSEQIGTGKSLRVGIRKIWYREKSRNQHWKNLVPGKSLGTGIGEIWYCSKISEHLLEKFDTGTDFRRQSLRILKIYNGYQYRIGTGTGNFSFLSGGIGTGMVKIWYWKKSGNRYR